MFSTFGILLSPFTASRTNEVIRREEANEDLVAVDHNQNERQPNEDEHVTLESARKYLNDEIKEKGYTMKVFRENVDLFFKLRCLTKNYFFGSSKNLEPIIDSLLRQYETNNYVVDNYSNYFELLESLLVLYQHNVFPAKIKTLVMGYYRTILVDVLATYNAKELSQTAINTLQTLYDLFIDSEFVESQLKSLETEEKKYNWSTAEFIEYSYKLSDDLRRQLISKLRRRYSNLSYDIEFNGPVLGHTSYDLVYVDSFAEIEKENATVNPKKIFDKMNYNNLILNNVEKIPDGVFDTKGLKDKLILFSNDKTIEFEFGSTVKFAVVEFVNCYFDFKTIFLDGCVEIVLRRCRKLKLELTSDANLEMISIDGCLLLELNMYESKKIENFSIRSSSEITVNNFNSSLTCRKLVVFQSSNILRLHTIKTFNSVLFSNVNSLDRYMNLLCRLCNIENLEVINCHSLFEGLFEGNNVKTLKSLALTDVTEVVFKKQLTSLKKLDIKSCGEMSLSCELIPAIVELKIKRTNILIKNVPQVFNKLSVLEIELEKSSTTRKKDEILLDLSRFVLPSISVITISNCNTENINLKRQYSVYLRVV